MISTTCLRHPIEYDLLHIIEQFKKIRAKIFLVSLSNTNFQVRLIMILISTMMTSLKFISLVV